MKRSELENSLRSAVICAPEIPFDELVDMHYVKMPEHDYITKQEIPTNPALIKRFAVVLICCLLVFLTLSGWFINFRTTDSIVTLDVNPSIEIRMNHRNEVLSVRDMNRDAKTVIENYRFKGKKYNETVTYLMNSLVKHGYLNKVKNTILLTVINNDKGKAKSLMNQTESAIKNSLSTSDFTPMIMKQLMKKETERRKLAQEYHISEGKLRLIQAMTSMNDNLSINMLADMTIQQLLELANKYSMDLSSYLIVTDGEDHSNRDVKKKSSKVDSNAGQDTSGQENTKKLPPPNENTKDIIKDGKEGHRNTNHIDDWQKPEGNLKDDQELRNQEEKEDQQDNEYKEDTDNENSDTGEEADNKSDVVADNQDDNTSTKGSNDSENKSEDENRDSQSAWASGLEDNKDLIKDNRQDKSDDSEQNGDYKDSKETEGNNYNGED